MVFQTGLGLVDPGVLVALPLGEALREPQGNLFPAILNGVTSMNDIPKQQNNIS
jgi:hypothetical protein